MTSLTVTAPLAAAKPAAVVTPPVFGPRIIIGLVGVLLAVLVSGLNEMVTKVALADIRGALAIGYDEGTWLVASYTATSVAAMAFAPWCSVTFSLRRFTLCAISAFTLLGVLCPFAPNYESLLVLRTLQGLAGGALPPMLMTVALRFLPANVKLYGLAGYALTATFGPVSARHWPGCGPSTSVGNGPSGKSSCRAWQRWRQWLTVCPRIRYGWNASNSSTGAVCCWGLRRSACW